MTSREIIKTLLQKEIPERVGLDEHFWPHIIANAWGAQGVESGTDFVGRFDLDIRNVSWFSVPGPCPELACVVEESDEWIVRRDGWGAATKYWKHKAGTPEHIGCAMTTPEIWQRDFRDALVALDVRQSLDVGLFRENCRY